jgi:multisubunit Na+/H+ antiporter MnhF subunit
LLFIVLVRRLIILLFSEQLLDVRLAKNPGVLDKFLAKETCHLSVVESFLVLIYLTQDCAEL